MALDVLLRWKAIRKGMILYVHCLPYILMICIACSILTIYAAEPRLATGPILSYKVLSVIIFGVLKGILAGALLGIIMEVILGLEGISMGVAGGIMMEIIMGIALGIDMGIYPVILTGIPVGVAGGSHGGIAMGIYMVIPTGISGEVAEAIDMGIYMGIIGGAFMVVIMVITGIKGLTAGLTAGIAWGIAVGIAMGITWGIAGGMTMGIAVGIAATRAYYQPLHLFFMWRYSKGQWYSWHPVAWDDLCALPFFGLDRLLIAYVEHHPEAGYREIERLIDTYPSQRMAALRAKAILLVRQAGQETQLDKLDDILAKMPRGEKGFLRYVPQILTLVHAISHEQTRLNTQERPFLREPTAALLCEKIKTFQSQVSGFPQPLATEFRTAARQWLTIAEEQRRKVEAILRRAPTPQVFRAGEPVDRNQEAFVPRMRVLEELDRQLTLSTGCPGLILYGRRRMGKSTLLRNMTDFLPTSVRLVTFSMENPNAFASQAGFIQLIVQELHSLWPDWLQAEARTLKDFFHVLTLWNAKLEESDQRLLLAIDEYEYLDLKIGEGLFTVDLLATLRESMQAQRRISWIFSGSHAITELPNAPWSSYLLSTTTLEIPLFTLDETRLLLTDPLQYSPLWAKDDPKRPRFDPAFWGEGGIERIQYESGGWPHLVQLLAQKAVDVCNDREQGRLDAMLLEEAATKAVSHGDVVLGQLMHPNEALPEEWTYLCGFRTRDTQPPPENEVVYNALKRRLLAEVVDGEWRLRVPLMQRWLRK